MRLSRVFAAAAVFVVLAVGCGGDDDDDADVGTAPTTTVDAAGTQETGSATVGVADSSLGRILVDGAGLTLYLFTKDAGGTSACEGGCAQTWPPLLVDGAPSAGDGVDAALLGALQRSDGGQQVTYNGHPLYRYATDAEPGDVKGQGVNDVWWAVDPAGNAVGQPAASGGSTTSTSAVRRTATTAARSAGSSGGPTPTEAAAPAPSPTSAPPTSAAAAPRAAITIEAFTFRPPVLQVATGTVVTTTNNDGAPHTWTADDGSWDSGQLGRGGSSSHTFTRAGTFEYHCEIHPSMTGSVIVS